MGLTVYEIRLKNLLLLMKESGLNKEEFANKVDTSPAYLSQIRSKKTRREMGNDLARKIEDAFNKNRGWMDTPHDADQNPYPYQGIERRSMPHQYSQDLTNKLIPNVDNAVSLGGDNAPSEGGNAPFKYNKVPLLEHDQIDNFLNDNLVAGMNELINTTLPVSKKTFAMRYYGDSMTGEFADGDIVTVEPEKLPKHGDFVVVKFGDDFSLRQLMIEAGDKYLKPLNDMYPMKQLKGSTIVGTVREKIKQYF